MTRTKGRSIPTTTIQIWPGGKSVEYRGEIDGPANQRSLRDGHYRAHARCATDCWPLRWDSDKREAYIAGHGVVPILFSDLRMGKHCVVREVAGGIAGFEVVLCPTCHGEGYTDNPHKNPWRKGTAAEWRAVRIEVRAELYGSRDVLGCDSSLVNDLIKAAGEGERGDLSEGFSYEEIRNIYRDCSEFDAADCREYASDHGIDLPDVPTLDCPKCEGQGETPVVNGSVPCLACGGITKPYREGSGQIPDPDAPEDDSRHGWLTEAREACQEHAQDNPADVYEWWRVSSWLCEQLHAIGEVTIDNNYGYWWGRTCTGQGWLMDGVLQRVAAQFERDEDEDRRKIAAVKTVVSGQGEQA